MSNIIINCPYCQQPLQVDESLLGRYADCPGCGRRLRLEKEVKESGSLSMVVPLVFQSIALGFTLLSLIVSASSLGGLFISPLLWIFACISAILAAVFGAILHYKCWQSLPAEFARLTPGKAVGFLFIPFFWFYWAFPSFSGLAQDCAGWARAKGGRGFTHLPALGLTYAILWVVSNASFTISACLAPFIGDSYSLGTNFAVAGGMGVFWFLGILASVGAFVFWIFLYRAILNILNGRGNNAATQVSR